MARLYRSLWPAGTARTWRRLVVAVVGAPLALSFGLTLLVLLSAGATEPSPRAVLAQAASAAMVFWQALIVFSLTFGSVGGVLLVALAQRGVLAWIVVGTLLGVLFAMAHGILTADAFRDIDLVLGAALGALHFMLIRGIAGVRQA